MTVSALLVANTTAGSADDGRVDEVAALLRQAYDLRVANTDTPAALRAALDDFAGEVVVVAGGDGSLHVLINALAACGRLASVAVGLVPLGTGNDFANGVGIPDDPLEAARACLAGAPQPVDVLTADDGEHVVNAAHAGIGAVAAERAQVAKPVAGKLAYPLGAIRAGVGEEGYRVTLTLDDRVVHDGAMLFALAANGPCIGGGTSFCSGADPADGLIDVVVIDDVPLHERPGLGIAIQRGTLGERDDVHSWRGRRLRIAGEPVDHNRDGEIRKQLADVTYVVRPAAWQLLR